MKARAAYIKSPWKSEIRTIDPGSPGPGEVLIRVDACGICGSDLFTLEANAKEWQPFGHEIAGRVESVGPPIDSSSGTVSVGDTVALESSSFCGKCESCRNGHIELCSDRPNLWGKPSLGFSDYLVAPARTVVPYHGVTAEVAALAEPAGVAIDLVKIADIELGNSVCVVGPGPIGLMAIPLALRAGASRVVCAGKRSNRRRLEIAESLGAEIRYVDGPEAERTELAKSFDRVLSTVPISAMVDAFAMLRFGGIVSYVGFGVGSGMISFDANDFHVRRLQLRASYASPALFLPLALELLRSNAIPGASIITHRFPLDHIADAITLCRERKNEIAKVMVLPA